MILDIWCPSCEARPGQPCLKKNGSLRKRPHGPRRGRPDRDWPFGPPPRPNWTQYFLNLATAVGDRSDCRRGKVGAVLVAPDHRVVSTGYPGVLPGAKGCLDGGCPRGLMSFTEMPSGEGYDLCPPKHRHAEWNCVDWAEAYDRDGATLYITREPCSLCRDYIQDEGILRVVWPTGEWYPESSQKVS